MPAKKIYRKKRVAKKRVVRKRTNKKNVAEWASLSENRTFVNPQSPNITSNTMFSLMNTTLDQFDRASTVAQGYQHYRIKHISIKIKPQFDTYTFNAGSGPTAQGYGKPKLYYMIDKSGALPTTVTLEMLKQMGAKPRNLDEKPLTIEWSPSVLTSDLTNTAPVSSQPSQYKISPWLSTSVNVVSPSPWNPSTVDHLGVYWYVESTSYGGTGGLPYQVDVEVQFQFKKPFINRSANTVPAIGLMPALLDASPDGIEGGPDGITIPIVSH